MYSNILLGLFYVFVSHNGIRRMDESHFKYETSGYLLCFCFNGIRRKDVSHFVGVGVNFIWIGVGFGEDKRHTLFILSL